MKKVLILAYDFPPYVSVGGLRPYNWYKYFKEFGIEPTVVTRQWDNKYGNHLDYISSSDKKEIILEVNERGKIIRTPYFPNRANKLMLKYGDKKYKLFRKAISAWYEFAQFFFPTGPKVQLFLEADKQLFQENYDFIIATGEPFVLFHYAAQLSKKYKTPWIADYRDPWSQGIYNEKKGLFNRFSKWVERRTVKSAQHITTVDELFKLKIAELFSYKEITVLPNGYDPEAIHRVAEIPQNNQELRIAFVGTIYDWHPLEHFMQTFDRFVHTITGNKGIKLIFYGTNKNAFIASLIEKQFPNLRNHIVLYDKVPNEELLKMLATDNVMLLFNYYAFTGTKIYDYIGLRRQILFCFNNDPVANALKKEYYFNSINGPQDFSPQKNIIQETNSGIVIENGSDLEKKIHALYSEFLGNGFISCNSTNTEKYSRKIQVQNFANLLLRK